MTEQEQHNVAIVNRWVTQVFNNKDWKAIWAMKDEETYASHTPFPGTTPNLAGFTQAFGQVLNAFPDFKFNVDEIIAKDDVVVVRGNWSGTHKGEYMGIAPTNQQIEVSRIDMLRLDGDKIVEHWGFGDDWNKIRTLTGAKPPESLPRL